MLQHVSEDKQFSIACNSVQHDTTGFSLTTQLHESSVVRPPSNTEKTAGHDLSSTTEAVLYTVSCYLRHINKFSEFQILMEKAIIFHSQ